MTVQPQVLRPARHRGLDLAGLTPGGQGLLAGVSIDSRAVRPGDLYVGLPGRRTHGGRFARDAVAAGAIAVLTDRPGSSLAGDLGVPVLVVDDPRLAMAELASRIYGRPADSLDVFGVTGTNGKTSTVCLLESALTALGRTVATAGTLGFRVAGRELASTRTTITTPESPDLQALLAVMAEAGADTLAMEVSSHALALHRVDAMQFHVAGFTMLGQDHLDFHGTQQRYFDAKAALFLGGRCRVAVVNVDDPWGATLADRVRGDGCAALVTTGAEGDFRLTSAEPAPEGGWAVTCATPHGTVRFALSMLGEFNVRNALTALAMTGAAGLDVEAASAGMARTQVPGRMQRLELAPGLPHVVIDFGHTPQAVAAALDALPRTGRRVAVLGAGGDRDASKRGLMGAAAAREADIVVVTDDNPRSEVPTAIRSAVLDGARAAAGPGVRVLDGGDRRGAIAAALGLAGPQDWVAVLGKGHETGQDIGGVVTPFDDVEVVLDLVAGRA